MWSGKNLVAWCYVGRGLACMLKYINLRQAAKSEATCCSEIALQIQNWEPTFDLQHGNNSPKSVSWVIQAITGISDWDNCKQTCPNSLPTVEWATRNLASVLCWPLADTVMLHWLYLVKRSMLVNLGIKAVKCSVPDPAARQCCYAVWSKAEWHRVCHALLEGCLCLQLDSLQPARAWVRLAVMSARLWRFTRMHRPFQLTLCTWNRSARGYRGGPGWFKVF